MPATTSIDEFLDLARRSGAVDSRRLSAFVNGLGDNAPDDPAKLAESLIQSGLMTKYQAEPLLQGQPRRFVLSGKYRLLDRLGAGGMASVFLCEHKIMRRRVAIKMLPPNLAANPSALDRFHREARAIASVHHTNIVAAHDIDQDGKIHFLVMEYVDGTNFHELVRRAGPLKIERACHYIAQACEGLQHAHDKGLVHRDIKPANLLVDRSGTVKILDLGLALVFQGDDDNLTRDHDANSILGTAEYLAPEQAIDSHGVDHRADLYSLGMTLYFLLTAKTPYGEGTTAQKLIWHQLRSPKPIREVRPEVSEELWAVLNKMLAKKPEERYQTANEIMEALAPWTGTPIPPPSESEMPKPMIALASDSPTTDVGYSSGTDSGTSQNTDAIALPTPLDVAAGGGRAKPSRATPAPAARSPLSSGVRTRPKAPSDGTPIPAKIRTAPASSGSGKPTKAKIAATIDDDEPISAKTKKKKKNKGEESSKSNQNVIILVATICGCGIMFGAYKIFAYLTADTSPNSQVVQVQKQAPTPPKPKPSPSTSNKPAPKPPESKPKPPEVKPTPPPMNEEPKQEPMPEIAQGPELLIHPRIAEPKVDGLTQDFFPMKPRELFYNTSILQRPGVWVVNRQKLDYKEEGEIEVTIIQSGLTRSADSVPSQWTPAAKPVIGRARVKIEDEKVHFGTPAGKDSNTYSWEPLIKIGAKEGDIWQGRLPNGDSRHYKLLEMQEWQGKPAAMVESRYQLNPSTEIISTHLLVKGLGEVERTENRMIRQGNKEQKVQTLLMRMIVD